MVYGESLGSPLFCGVEGSRKMRIGLENRCGSRRASSRVGARDRSQGKEKEQAWR